MRQYLLFDGTSVDGRGQPSYICLTLDKQVAATHHRDCNDNVYSNGYVMILTEHSFKRAEDEDFLG